MKINITFKTPDAIDYAAQDYFSDDGDIEEFKEFCSKWVEYGELIRIEFDTEKRTATVLEV